MSSSASAQRLAADGRHLHVVVAAPPRVRRPADLLELCGAADLIELRFDLLLAEAEGVSVAAWIAASPRPVLATLRSLGEGGQFEGSPSEAARLLEQAASSGAAWIDVESAVAPHLGALPAGVHVLPSSHGADAQAVEPPVRLEGHVRFAKVARPIDDAHAWRDLKHLVFEPSSDAPAFLVPYGALAATRGAFVGAGRSGLLYGSAADEAAVVPGQPRLDVLLDELRAGEVGPTAELFGLVGAPPARSPSPAMHNAVFRARGVEALYVPLPGLTLEGAIALPARGLSVTTPYKRAALQAADHLDDMARTVGAVNTLVRRADGSWAGSNTDASGLRRLLAPASDKAQAFVLGAGGYARAAVWALEQRGYDVRLGARHEERGRRAAEALDASFAGLGYARQPGDAVVVNATPAGARGEDVEAFVGSDLHGLVVLDAPYAPAGQTTGLARQARAQGAAFLHDGRALLGAQAHDQALAFGATEDEVPHLDRILSLALEPPPSLYLMGGRAAGKTSAGRRVARLLGRPFVDLDAEIERITGRSAATWIQTEGWEAFRRVEHVALERVSVRRGLVVACGGGVVDFEPNLDLMRDAGTCVLLRVSPEVAAERSEADPTPRPRWPGCESALEEARVLLSRRAPRWLTLADHIVDADASLKDVVSVLVAAWCV